MSIQLVRIIFGVFFLICATEDLIRKRIHILFFIMMAVVAVADFGVNPEISLWMRAAGIAAGGIFIFLSRVTRGQIGMGDGILLMIIGGYLGILSFMEVVMYGFFLSALAGIILLCIKKMDKKRKMPLVPFLFAGFVLCQWIGG